MQSHLKGLFFRTRIINKQIIYALARTLFPNIEINRKSDQAALQSWAFKSYRDYNMVL
jgi:hypothetical protein